MSEYEYDENGYLLCFGFKPSFTDGKFEKTTVTVEDLCVDVNSHGHFGDSEYVYSSAWRRDEEWDSRYWEWSDDEIDRERYPPSEANLKRFREEEGFCYLTGESVEGGGEE